MRTLFLVLAVAIVAAGCGGDTTYESPYRDGGATSAGSTPTLTTKKLTDQEANSILNFRCLTCHTNGRWKNATLSTKADWEDAINRCIQEGAQLRPVEKDSLVMYMQANFGK